MKEIIVFFTGVAFGVIIALLLAPESGADLRANIKSKVDNELPKLKSDFQASMKKTDQRLDKVEADLKKTQTQSG
jgi:gas vesicle protein